MHFADQLLQALSRTFLHSFWQGLVLSIIAGLIMLFTAKTSSSLRYRLLTASFFAFIAGIAFTFYHEWNAVAAGESLLPAGAGSHTVNSVLQQAWFSNVSAMLSQLLRDHSTWIVLVWSAIVMIKSAKMTLDLLYISRLRSHRVYSPVDEWKSRLTTLASQIGVKKAVSLVESGMIKVPMVLGHLKPIILMPVGVLNNMSEAEIEAVLLHELAHIRRHDYLINFLQRIAECLLFFNPGLLWVSGLMRIERENCCDDMAIARTDNRLQFAEALISFKKYSMDPQSYIIGFAGRRNVLLQRMTRIVYRKNTTLTLFEIVFFAVNIALLSLLFITKGHQETRLFADNTELAIRQPAASFAVQSLPLQESPVTEKERPSVIRTKINREKPANRSTAASVVVSEKQKAFELQQTIVAIEPHQEITQPIEENIKIREQRRLAEIMRIEAEQQRAKAEINRQIAEKKREEAAVYRKKAEEERAIAEIHRNEAELHRREADRIRRSNEETRRQTQQLLHSPEYQNTYQH
ncbi:MAG: M48 family metalloprotease [Chitinophagaceae bacterium]|nr:M48 family metalloprotease [Chitinophagaceae bacterium]